MKAELKASEELVESLKAAEELRLVAYQDQAGVWTLGYGKTRYGTRKIQPGETCTAEQAEAWIRYDIAIAERIVRAALRVPLSQRQFDALVMFAFNTGTLGVRLKQALNSWNIPEVFKAWREWIFITDPVTKIKRVSKGLVNRREKELRIWQHGIV